MDKLQEISWIGFQQNIIYLGELLQRDKVSPDVMAAWESVMAHAAILEQEALKDTKVSLKPAQ